MEVVKLDTSLLYNSTICRLCGEENINGTLLYSCEENERNLSDVINAYLPIKISDDGHLPRTICPGCNIQLEATVEFFDLIISGQKIIRNLHLKEKEHQKGNHSDVIYVTDIDTKNGVYHLEHPITLQVAGLDKPKRKRGRPPKKAKTPEELEREAQEAKSHEQKDAVASENQDVTEATGKRKRKTPQRFKEAVQGKEMERIFIEEGVIDGDDSDNDAVPDVAVPTTMSEPKEPEVIGHLETSGELVVVTKGKGRGRPRGRMRATKEECAICGMSFSCLGRYMSHVAQHGRVTYVCAECSESFGTRLEFNRHQEQRGHAGQRVVQCDRDDDGADSDASNTSQSDLKGIESIVDNVQQTDIPTVMADLNGDATMAKAVYEKSVTSPSGQLVISEDRDVKVAFKDLINQTNPGTDIGQVNSSSTEHKADEESSKENENVIGKSKLKCNHCDKVFNSKQSKSLHIKAKHAGERPYQCKECGARFPYPRSLSLHALTHRRTNTSRGFACDLCGKVLNHPSSVVYHKEAEHAGQRYVCSKCDKSFKHRQLLQRHQMVHSQLRPFNCKDCQLSFKTKANLVNHQLLHSGVKKFGCDLCKQRFAHKTSLTLHMRWHTGLKPYACGVCGKRFTQKGNLSEHERIHTGEKPYRCALCPRAFTTSSQHRLHARRHAGDLPYACTHCPKRFLSRETWRVHMRREAGARDHRCEQCGRAFCERWALLKHRRRHTGERPFRCPHCQRAFADCSNLNKHKKQVHKQISLLLSEKVVKEAATAAVTLETAAVDAEASRNSELEEQVIYVTYDADDAEATAFHIMDSDQAASLDGSKVLTTCDLYEGDSLLVGDNGILLEQPLKSEPQRAPEGHVKELDAEVDVGMDVPMHSRLYYEDEEIDGRVMMQQHVTMMDGAGNPVQFTMQDGTRISIASVDGKCLQVVTEDGQTIPVQINGYNNEEDAESTEQMESLTLQNGVGVAMDGDSVTVDENGIVVDGVGAMADGQPLRMLTLGDSSPITHYFTIV